MKTHVEPVLRVVLAVVPSSVTVSAPLRKGSGGVPSSKPVTAVALRSVPAATHTVCFSVVPSPGVVIAVPATDTLHHALKL
jgi:hypothetical protein